MAGARERGSEKEHERIEGPAQRRAPSATSRLAALMDRVGNRGVLELMRSCCGPTTSAPCDACETPAIPAGVMPKLEVSRPSDPRERDADATADRVMRSAAGPERHAHDRRTATRDVDSRVHALPGTGQPLPASERAFFEPRMGADFGDVRIHTDPESGQLARELGARAFTLSNHVVMAPGRWSPGTREGRHLLAHELAHVMQAQRGIFLTPHGDLPNVLEQLREIGPRSTRAESSVVVDRIMAAIGSVPLSDPDNFVPISQAVAESFTSPVYLAWLQRVDSLPPGQRPSARQAPDLSVFQPRGHPYLGRGGVGLFPYTGAALSPAAQLVQRTIRSAGAFLEGLLDGLRNNLSEADFQALAGRLAGSAVVNIVMPAIFAAGTVVGVAQQIAGLVQTIVEIVGDLPGFVDTVVSFIARFLEDADYAYELGVDIGTGFAADIRTLSQQNIIEFTYNLGRIVGPIIVDIILAYFGIGVISGSARLARFGARLLRIAPDSRAGRALARARALVRPRPHAPDVEAPTRRPDAPERRPDPSERHPDAPGAGRAIASLPGCRTGSILCEVIPRRVLRDPEVGSYPTPDRVPRPGGPYTLRGTTDATYTTLRAVTGEQLRVIYLANPRVWTDEFRAAWRATNGHLGSGHIDDVLAGRRSARGSSWPSHDGRPWEVHHRRPLDFGGDNSPGNLVALEHSVHRTYTTWWGRVKSRIRRLFLEDGTADEWRRLIGGEADEALTRAGQRQ